MNNVHLLSLRQQLGYIFVGHGVRHPSCLYHTLPIVSRHVGGRVVFLIVSSDQTTTKYFIGTLTQFTRPLDRSSNPKIRK